MNQVIIGGRLAADPDISYSAEGQNAVARFRIAAYRGKKDGKDLGADFIPCVAFGVTAEIFEKYIHKGDQIFISGKIRTSSYEHEGKTIYTWNVQANRVEFGMSAGKPKAKKETFEEVDEDCPF